MSCQGPGRPALQSCPPDRKQTAPAKYQSRGNDVRLLQAVLRFYQTHPPVSATDKVVSKKKKQIYAGKRGVFTHRREAVCTLKKREENKKNVNNKGTQYLQLDQLNLSATQF